MTSRRSFLQGLSAAFAAACAGVSASANPSREQRTEPGQYSFKTSSVIFDPAGANVDMKDEEFRNCYLWPAVHMLREQAGLNGAKEFVMLPDAKHAHWQQFVQVHGMPIRFIAAYAIMEDTVLVRADCAYIT